MGGCNSLDILQGFKYIRAYLDHILVLMTGDWTNHLTKLEQVLDKVWENRIKVYIEKSFFGQS